MKQGKRKGSKRIKKEDMLASVVEFFNQDRKRAFNYKQVAHGVGATTTPQKQMVFQLLEGMAEQNFLIEVSPGKYKANSRGTEVIGRFERRVNGKNHVITDDDESIFIAERNAMHAMDGDRVRVLVYAEAQRARCRRRGGRDCRKDSPNICRNVGGAETFLHSC